ncbi:MAG: nucleotidyltransferase domain-containing protein [Methanotrichaceae archaeon]|nr:nucleotidyltransferase domain-containing protein [Methanotrichaceae archaeon]
MMNNPKTVDQQKADAFLEEFVGEIGKAYGSEIDFILLFGSAARGEFVLGKSDVDLIIQVKSDAVVRSVEQFAEQLFWQLDEKHGMQFKRVVSTGKGGSLLEDALKLLEKQARLYKPFEVFGPDDIDWRSGKIQRLDLLPGATLVASQLTLFYKMKHEGRILFGRDIRPEIKPRFTWWEKLKAIWAAQSIAFASVILALLLPQKAVGYAVKALFYEVDSVNIFQKNMIPSGQEKVASFAEASQFDERILDDMRFFLERKLGLLSEQKMQFVREAAMIKKQGFKGGRRDALQFCRRAFWIIWSTNAAVTIKSGGNL